ncbi:hypothetical protein QGX11_gp081 [Pseudomonas phage PPSC2]|uniref:Uncharacterized protein n=1 Tax=Pseudomonas phage PPSC2 TaxID=2041350 RepID=A0A2R2YAN9_9CAUD|nr:hypothetical protein QGX11_gp081 [Pseudomonas phage PPSC2]ATN92844.1 hypothetical protein PPSC2_81 [Pseudomonas phage PPSC2]
MWSADAVKRDKLNEIANLLNQAQNLVLEAQTIADEYGLEFDLDIGGYGMGGTYYSEKYVEEIGSRYTTAGWNPSSQSC